MLIKKIDVYTWVSYKPYPFRIATYNDLSFLYSMFNGDFDYFSYY